MQYRLFPFLVTFFFLSGCNNANNKELTKKNITGSWRLFNIENGTAINAGGQEKLLAEADNQQQVKEGVVVSFFKDGSYTEINGAGNYITGKWKYSSKENTLYFSDAGGERTFGVAQEFINEKQIINLTPANARGKLRFTKTAEALPEADEDPFFFKNNTWRIKPKQAEDHQQIVKRLGNYFRHLLYILKSSKERKQDIVSFEFSQGLVRIYNGGIGIIPYQVVSKNWINTYYNEENAQEAYDAFQKYLATNSYRGAAIGNWIEDDYNILLSIYADTQKGKF